MSRRRALAVNQVFAYRLRDARRAKGWDQQQLADAMDAIGHPINRATISKIEAGARGVGGEHGRDPIRGGQTPPRGVSLEEAIAFSVALGVSPASMFLPLAKVDDVQLTPKVRADVDHAHAWVRGERPLTPDDEEEAARFYHFQRYARPASLADLESLGIQVVHEPPTSSRKGGAH